MIFRNTRLWPIYLAVVFALYYVFYLGWNKKKHLLNNFCNGVMLNFALAVRVRICEKTVPCVGVFEI